MSAEFISVEDATRLISESSKLVRSERLPLLQAYGRVLREDAVADGPLPPFDQSAMDGFAVRSTDVAHARRDSPVRLRIIGEIAAGDAPNRALGSRQAFAIMTGAPVPDRADAVVIKERVLLDGEDVLISSPADPGANIRRAGEDLGQGSLAVAQGSVIDGHSAMVLASVGCAQPLVARRVRVSLVVTGSELVNPDAPLRPGQVRDSNTALLEGLLRSEEVEIASSVRCVDARKDLSSALSSALEVADVVLVTGGVSVGNYDYTRDVLRDLGTREVFYKVAQKPGKPLYYGVGGRAASVQVFGLPGNPVSAATCFSRYVRPAIRSRLGANDPWPRYVHAKNASLIGKKAGLVFFCHGVLEVSDGEIFFRATEGQGSHMVYRMAQSHALAELPSEAESIPKGALVSVFMTRPRSSIDER